MGCRGGGGGVVSKVTEKYYIPRLVTKDKVDIGCLLGAIPFWMLLSIK